MKKIVSFGLVLAFLLTLVGCGEVRTLYKYDLAEYVTVEDYAVTVDTQSKDYLEYYNEFDEQYADSLRLEVKEGTVADGDTINIDYTGYLDGKAFEGGTDTGYDLTIGSNSFIEGFEKSLIGATIGSTVDIKVTFPTNYGVESLNGREATFTVKVNYKVSLDKVTTGNVKKLGFETLEDYMNAKREYAVINVAWDEIYSKSKIIDYPQKELDIIFDETVAFLEEACKQNDMTLEDFISYNNMTEESFNEYLMEYDVKYSVYRDLICYRILDMEEYELTNEDLEQGKKDLQSSEDGKGVTYTKGMIEERAAYLAAKKIILEKVTVK